MKNFENEVIFFIYFRNERQSHSSRRRTAVELSKSSFSEIKVFRI